MVEFLAQWERFFYRKDFSSTPNHTTEGTTKLPVAKLVLLVSNVSTRPFPQLFAREVQIHLLMLWRKICKSSFVKRSLVSDLTKTEHHFFDPRRNRKKGPEILIHHQCPTQSKPALVLEQAGTLPSALLPFLLILHTLSHLCRFHTTSWVASVQLWGARLDGCVSS